MWRLSWLVLLLGGCGGGGASAVDAAAVAVDSGPISGCTRCLSAATCGGLECIDGTCLKPCQSGGECPSRPGGPIAECGVSIPDDAGVNHYYCAGGCPP